MNDPKCGLGIIDRLHAGNEFVGSVKARTVVAKIPDIVALVEQDIEEGRKSGIQVGVKPHLYGTKIWRTQVLPDLLRTAERYVGSPPVSAPAFLSGSYTKTCVGISDPLIDIFFISV